MMPNTLSQLNGFVYNAYSLGFLKDEVRTSIEKFFEGMVEENNYMNLS